MKFSFMRSLGKKTLGRYNTCLILLQVVRKKEPRKTEMTIYGPALNKYWIVKRFSPLYNEVHKEAFPVMKMKIVRSEKPS
jgi:hypothetical protein